MNQGDKQVFKINHPIDHVHDVIFDLKKFGHYHPLIVDVEELAQCHFRVKEKPFSSLPFVMHYEAKAEGVDEKNIRYKVTGIPLHKPELYFSLQKLSENKTQVDVSIYFLNKGIGQKILKKKMMKAQQELWAAVNESN